MQITHSSRDARYMWKLQLANTKAHSVRWRCVNIETETLARLQGHEHLLVH